MTFPVGSLIKARNRTWVVQHGTTDRVVIARPVSGTDDETVGLLTEVEPVEPDSFDWPDPTRTGDHLSARLLRDAMRLSSRAAAGPFRSFPAIAVEPRAYQLVPLLMALRLDPVRLLIADDVGIGKTVEACLVAKELLLSGETDRLCVLCPPHLVEQWQTELSSKFHIDAEMVLASTAARLERGLPPDESLFNLYPYTVVSMDFIKSDRRRDEFLRNCPNLVVVDEAHTCAADPDRRAARHQRHELLSRLAADTTRHLILVTASPHSGNEGAFRSLLRLLDQQFADLPDEDRVDDRTRAQLARHFVQRRRADITHYADEDTPFPERRDLPENEGRYQLSVAYRELVTEALAWARERVADQTGGKHRQRVRWWAVLGLLRSLASSPAAAEATLRARAQSAATSAPDEADAAGRRVVLDFDEDDSVQQADTVPGTDPGDAEQPDTAARLHAMADMAAGLRGDKHDTKLALAAQLVDQLLADGFNPIVFCRFIDTAEYVAEQLARHLGRAAAVMAVTSTLAAPEREARVLELSEAPRRVLVATDCLSEGINLQESFNAVVHYDLPWNPTRLEQREGRVDRYGQPSPEVRVATIAGTDNLIDEIVMDVLLRKHRKIRSALGVSIPVPGSNDELIESVFDRLFQEEQLNLFTPAPEDVQTELFARWDAAAEREKRSRTRYAQHSISTEQVMRELVAARASAGSTEDAARFTRDAVRAFGGTYQDGTPVVIDLSGFPAGLRDAVALTVPGTIVRARWQLPVRDGEVHLSRTHPFVETLATWVLDTALDPQTDSPASRTSVIRTDVVDALTAMVTLRYRYDLVLPTPDGRDDTRLTEDTEIVAVTGLDSTPRLLDPDPTARLVDAAPTGIVPAEQRSRLAALVINERARLQPLFNQRAEQHANLVLEAHRRVRSEAGARTRGLRVRPHLPADVVAVHLLIP